MAVNEEELMRMWKKGMSLLLAGSMVLGALHMGESSGSLTKEIVAHAAAQERTLTIDGNTLVTTENSAFRGLGAVTCNNSSRLLMDYKEEHEEEYWEIMNWLFNKKSGAGLSHIKIELGCDADTSSGAEPATKRSAGQKANVNRGAGFMFAHDALSINQDITVDMLCWGMPAWVEQAYEKSEQAGFKARYRWYKETIDAAYDKWDITFSYVSANRNEGAIEKDWTKYLRKALDTEKIQRYDYSKIKLVTADEEDTMHVAEEMLKDKEYRDAVDVIGCHDNPYMDELVNILHTQYNKEIWFSEGASVVTDSVFGVNNTEDGQATSGTHGMLDIANRIIIGMAQSDMTLYEFQPAVASYYDGSAYFPKQLIRANSPWSGDYTIGNGLVMAMHFTNFIKKGWKIVESGSYADGALNGHSIINTMDNCLTAAKKSTGDYSTVITNDSETARIYQVRVSGLKKASAKVSLWETRSCEDGDAYDAHWLERIGTLIPTKEGEVYTYEVKVKPYSMVTLTTTTGQTEYASRKAKTSVGTVADTKLQLPYTENFEYKEAYLKRRGKTPHYTCDVNGAFEVIGQTEGNHVLRQQINQDHLSTGLGGSVTEPVTSFGDDTWKDYIVSADIMLDPNENTKNYAGIIARYNAVQSIAENGYQLRIYRKGSWKLFSNQGMIADGIISGMREGRMVNLKLKVLGNTVTAYINNEQVAKMTVDKSPANSGRVALVSAYCQNSFDNIKVLPIAGGITHVTRVDDLDSALQFSDSVSRLQSRSYRYYGRTVSILEEKSASCSYSFAGTGISFLGNNLAGAKVKITLDGKEQEGSYAIKATEHRAAFYQLSGLEEGNHTIQIELVNNEPVYIDAVEIEGKKYVTEAVPAEEITVEHETLDLAYGKSVSLGVKTVPENAAEEVIYTTSNMAVAMVSSDGRVTANGAGKAVVTAALGNGKTAVTEVTVTQLAITPRSGIRVGVGEKVRLKAAYLKGINKASIKKWKSSNKKLATVAANGVVTTKKAGYVTITAVGRNGYKAKAVVHIRKAPYRLKVSPKKKTLEMGETKQIHYEVPSGCFASKVTFKSSNPQIAKVSDAGLIKAKKAGTCTITVETYNGKKAVLNITVK